MGSGEGLSRQWDGVSEDLEEGVVITLGCSLGNEEVITVGWFSAMVLSPGCTFQLSGDLYQKCYPQLVSTP